MFPLSYSFLFALFFAWLSFPSLLAVLGFELRTSGLVGRHLSHSASPFLLCIFYLFTFYFILFTLICVYIVWTTSSHLPPILYF
jgi:hypothetical protein